MVRFQSLIGHTWLVRFQRYSTVRSARLDSFFASSLKLCSSLSSPRLDLKSRSRNLARVGMHRDIHPQTREGSSYDAAREVEILNGECQRKDSKRDLAN